MLNLLNAGALALLFCTQPNALDCRDEPPVKVMVEEALEGDPHKRKILEVIQCESGFNPIKQSEHPDPKGPNGQENSWGLVQINLDYHPSVTLDQALDWKFSLEFIRKHFRDGKQNLWTCYRKSNG